MNSSHKKYLWVWIGFIATIGSSWAGLVILPILNLGALNEVRDEATAGIGPTPAADIIDLGREVYVSQGCMYCHSQQVRPEYAGGDQKMGWGQRRTMPEDYLNDKVALLGTMRTGPDLSNIGVRQPSEDWHLLHLYHPQITSEGSIMAPYPFLFKKQKIGDEPHPQALNLTGKYAPEAGYEVIPTREVLALVEYLKSLKKSNTPLETADPS
ncbi:MAG: cbb3-type cytochrome c oxidase subunit II [Verrucomicrobiota bacterium]